MHRKYILCLSCVISEYLASMNYEIVFICILLIGIVIYITEVERQFDFKLLTNANDILIHCSISFQDMFASLMGRERFIRKLSYVFIQSLEAMNFSE